MVSHLTLCQPGFTGIATLLKVVAGFLFFMFWFMQTFSRLFSMDLTRTQATSINIVKFLLLPYSFYQFAGVYFLGKNSNARVKNAVAYEGAMQAMTAQEKTALKRGEYGARGDAAYETDKSVQHFRGERDQWKN